MSRLNRCVDIPEGWMGRHMDGEHTYAHQTDKQTDKHTNRQTDKQTNRQTDKQTNRQTDKQTNRQTDKQTNRQTDKQTNKQNLTLLHKNCCVLYSMKVHLPGH